MKTIALRLQIFFFVLLLMQSGCELIPVADELHDKANDGSDVHIYTHYTPVEIDIMPLTEFTGLGNTEEMPKIKAYVSLLDCFDCQKKSPGVFRFELYEYVQRSAEHKGRRILIWPDIDLTEQSENNGHWRDFLRAYEFNLDFEPQPNQSYVLQVTCMCPNGKRLSAEFALKHTK